MTQLTQCKPPAAARWAATGFTVLALLGAAGIARATPLPFYATTDAAQWQVATQVGGIDGDFGSFPTSGFETAVAVTGRVSEGVGWIANNAAGTNGSLGTWTFFVFRQIFDLGDHDPLTAVLNFRWAADDSGEVGATRGSWTPKYRLNGGPLVNGSWPTTYTYDLGNPTSITQGFTAGLNTIEFFVQGNGVTDGMALTGTLTTGVPLPSTAALAVAGLALVGGLSRRRGRSGAG